MSKKKKVIEFNEQAYQQAQHKYHLYIKKVHEAIEVAKHQTGIELTPDEIKEGRAYETLKKKFTEKHKSKNTLGLKAEKLMSLLEIDFQAIIKAFDSLGMHPVRSQPKADHYTTYAETPQEVERLENVEKLLEAFKSLNIKSPMDLRGLRQVKHVSGQFHPDPNFIKQP